MTGTVAYILSKKYAEKLSSGVSGSTYDPATSTMTVIMNDGTSYTVVFDDGVTTADREFLDNITYDSTTGELQIDGKTVLTETSEMPDDLDFSDMF